MMKTIGVSILVATCRCTSRALVPGSDTSRTRQHGTVGGDRDRNSSAEPQLSMSTPVVASSFSTDRRASSSSATRNTVRGPVRADDDNLSGPDSLLESSVAMLVMRASH
jgi:hypothetical protein